MNLDYKSMSDGELKKIILDIRTISSRLMDQVSALQQRSFSREAQEEKEQIVSEYARLKGQLKEIYHYTQLGRNELPGHNFYNAYFCPAIRDCYLHCDAKTNERNLSKLLSSLYQIWSEAIYHSDED